MLDTSPLEIILPNEDMFKVDEVKDFVDTQYEYDITMYFDGLRCE